MKKIAFITQSYKNDYKECALLCKSFDRFVPKEIMHFIFVNDEDYDLFLNLQDNRHIIYKKSTVLPKWLIRCPFKMLGHHYHISPFTIPVREWIIQQICKLGVFEVIGDSFDAVFNIDSESIFMRPLKIDTLIKDDKFILYKSHNQVEPNYEEYCNAAKKLLNINDTIENISLYNYMSTPVCFEKNNLTNMLKLISKNNYFNSWKLALCNTYRFSENYLYGNYITYKSNLNNHFYMDKYLFPLLDIAKIQSTNELKAEIEIKLSDKEIFGVLLQKSNRKLNSNKYLNFENIQSIIVELWEKEK